MRPRVVVNVDVDVAVYRHVLHANPAITVPIRIGADMLAAVVVVVVHGQMELKTILRVADAPCGTGAVSGAAKQDGAVMCPHHRPGES